MKRPKDFPIDFPPGTKVVGINLGRLDINPTPAKVKGGGGRKLANPAAAVTLAWPILSLDISSTATGWARKEGPEHHPTFGLIRPPGSRTSIERIDLTADRLLEFVREAIPALVVCEWSAGFHHGSTGRKMTHLSTLGAAQGAAREAIRRESIRTGGFRIECVLDTTWTSGTPKPKRARRVRETHPDYARWAEGGNDKGYDAADAIGLLDWFLARNPA